MSNISKIKVGDTTYDIEDTVARNSGGGLSADVKQALLSLLQKVAYIDANGQTYYNNLQTALYPSANLSSISAVYTQSGTVYDTDSLDSLKSDLVVTAHYSDSSTETVTSYALSGTLSVGTSTITVTYGGKTTTFNVTVSSMPWTYEWNYTDGLPDSNGLTKQQNGTVTTNMESNGLRITIAENDSNDIKYLYRYTDTTKYTKIVYEVSLIPVTLSTVNGRGIRVNTGIGGYGAGASLGTQLAVNVNGIQYLGEASGWSLLTSNTLTVNEEHTIRIEHVEGSADIYVDETFVGTITSFREKVGFPAIQFRNLSDTIFTSFKVRCID